jgi:low molecular weight protein-tyrosine phosphatase
VTSPDPTRPPFTVLFVCTGNICRSPLAERLGRSVLDGATGASAVRLHSAGVRAVVGSGMHPDSARALQRYGVEAADFVARRLQEHMVTEADLVLTMTAEHRQQVLERSPRALGRTFTLREAADLTLLVGAGAAPGGADGVDRVRAWVRALAGSRSRRRGAGHDDVRDPVGLASEAHDEAAATIAAALEPLLGRIADLAAVAVTSSPPRVPPAAAGTQLDGVPA